MEINDAKLQLLQRIDNLYRFVSPEMNFINLISSNYSLSTSKPI